LLVIVASERDPAALALAERWGADARLLTPADLSRRGWRFDPADPAAGSAVVDGRQVQVAAIDGVVTRLPAVYEADLARIVAADRRYVAQEMTAFLLAWLSALPCRVVNRPVPPSLGGPAWQRHHWTSAARRARLPLSDDGEGGRTLTVVGGRCVEPADPADARLAVALAGATGLDLLAVRVGPTGNGTSGFVRADPWPDPSRPDVADALLAHLCP
jgi:hypothetical protein